MPSSSWWPQEAFNSFEGSCETLRFLGADLIDVNECYKQGK